MHIIECYIESHWAVQRPDLSFRLNGNDVEVFNVQYAKKEDFVEKSVFKFAVKELTSTNRLEIVLQNKTNDLITEQSDHWVDIKNIFLDGIGADWLLYKHTYFRHSMSKSWVAEMKKNGYDIQKEYRPGTEIKLNGVFGFEFYSPFWLFKTKQLVIQ